MIDLRVTRDDAHLVRLQAQRPAGARVAVVGEVQPWSALRAQAGDAGQPDRRGLHRRRRQVAILLDTRRRNDRRRIDLFA